MFQELQIPATTGRLCVAIFGRSILFLDLRLLWSHRQQ